MKHKSKFIKIIVYIYNCFKNIKWRICYNITCESEIAIVPLINQPSIKKVDET